jgi:hypothetical protein
MPQLKITLCSKCNRTINDLWGAHGRESAMQAAPSILADCEVCKHQIPDDLRASIQAGQYETRDKSAPPPETFVETARIIIP